MSKRTKDRIRSLEGFLESASALPLDASTALVKPGEIKTPCGRYRTDATGVWHYQTTTIVGLAGALVDALSTEVHPAWFWFNGTGAPIVYGDNPGALGQRYVQWREVMQSQRELLALLTESAAPVEG